MMQKVARTPIAAERRKTMPETDIVSNTRRIGRAGIAVRITPLREAFPANPGIPEPE